MFAGRDLCTAACVWVITAAAIAILDGNDKLVKLSSPIKKGKLVVYEAQVPANAKEVRGSGWSGWQIVGARRLDRSTPYRCLV